MQSFHYYPFQKSFFFNPIFYQFLIQIFKKPVKYLELFAFTKSDTENITWNLCESFQAFLDFEMIFY